MKCRFAVTLPFALLLAQTSNKSAVTAFLIGRTAGGSTTAAPPSLFEPSYHEQATTATASTTALEATPSTSASKTQPGGVILGPADEAALLQESTFPIAPDKLIETCKGVILAQVGIQDGSIDESIYSDDFRFVAPFIGGPSPKEPQQQVKGLDKQSYLSNLRSFDLLTAFPDMDNRYHGFYVDPYEPNRVWFRTRCLATHTGELLGNPPTGKSLELPPQSFSMVFNEAGQVMKFDVGYVTDRTVGNTGGLGGAFGFFYATGNALPFPECQPFQPSWQLGVLGALGDLQKKFGGGDKKSE